MRLLSRAAFDKFQRQKAYQEWDAKGGRVVVRNPSEIPDDAVSAVSVVADSISRLKRSRVCNPPLGRRRAAFAPAYLLVAGLEAAWPLVIGMIPIWRAASFERNCHRTLLSTMKERAEMHDI